MMPGKYFITLLVLFGWNLNGKKNKFKHKIYTLTEKATACNVQLSFQYLQHTCFHPFYHKASTGITKCYEFIFVCWSESEPKIQFKTHAHAWMKRTAHSRMFWKSKANGNTLKANNYVRDNWHLPDVASSRRRSVNIKQCVFPLFLMSWHCVREVTGL